MFSREYFLMSSGVASASGVGVLEEQFLDLPGVDVVPPGDGHVFLAVDNVEEPVLVPVPEVLGVKPPRSRCLGEGLLVGLRAVVVSIVFDQ
jgi:hypothetical protein